jgi:hypothetical protein
MSNVDRSSSGRTRALKIATLAQYHRENPTKNDFGGEKRASGDTLTVRKAGDLENCACVQTVPSAPANLRSVIANDGKSAQIYFEQESNGRCTITNYEYSINGDDFRPFEPAQVRSPVTIAPIADGRTYRVYIRAVNCVGVSDYSAEIVLSPVC